MSGMNFLEKLLDGVAVEWKTLEEVAIKISSGGTPKTGVSEYYDGDIPWLRTQEVDFGEIWDTGVKITEAGLKNSSAKWIPENCVILAMYGATVGKIGINKIPMTTNQACANIQLDGNVANYRYVFHFLSGQYEYIKSLGTGSQTNINAGIVKKLQIPIPCPDNPDRSLAIQAEIVRILDTFTALTAELTAELGDRQKQYNYYRDRLLTFEEGEMEWKTLGDVATLITKGTTPKVFTDSGVNFVKLESFDNGRIDPVKFMFVSIEAHSKELKRSILQSNDILFAIAGATIGKCTVVEQSILPANTNQALAIVRLGESVNVKFVFYCMQTTAMKEYIAKYNKASAQPNLNLQQISDFRIPFPPLPEQARIVAILDKFDTLTNSISEGLPREIELRQQQYEYYRDLLLTFPKAEEQR
jgi:type I restriction enzyme, S subunit